MKRNQQWTATWCGVTHTDSLTGWALRTSKSRTFLTNMVHEAISKNIPADEAMQYAIEQVPGERRRGYKKVNSVRKEVSRAAHETAFRNKHKERINAFLYSKTPTHITH